MLSSKFVVSLAGLGVILLMGVAWGSEDKCCPGNGDYEDCSGCVISGIFWYEAGNNDYDYCIDYRFGDRDCDDDPNGECFYLTAPMTFYTSYDNCTAGIAGGTQQIDQASNTEKCDDSDDDCSSPPV